MTLPVCAPNDLLLPDVSNPQLQHIKTPLSRQTSNSSLDNKRVMNFSSSSSKEQVIINLREHYEGNEASGITCVNSHEVLKRNDSSGGMILPTEEKIIKDSMSQYVSVSDIVLKPGENIVTLDCEVCMVSVF